MLLDYKTKKRIANKQRRNRRWAAEIFRPPKPLEIANEVWGSTLSIRHRLRLSRKARRAEEAVDLELWRAEKRFQLGSWAALLDCLSVCRANQLPLPIWATSELAGFAPGALVRPGSPSKVPPRLRQNEVQRLQAQKCGQIFGGIKDWQEMSATKGDGSIRNNARLASEFANLTDERVRQCTNDHKRAQLTHDLLRNSEVKFFRRSVGAIEGSLRKHSQETEIQFGVTLGATLDPDLFFWDIPFVRTETLKFLEGADK